MADVIGGALLAVLGLAVTVVSRNYPAPRAGPGAGTLPFLLGLVLLALASWVCVSALIRRKRQPSRATAAGEGVAADEERRPAGRVVNVLLVCAAVAGYLLAMDLVGYFAATMAFITGYTVLLYRVRGRLGLLSALLMVAASYMVFSALGVPLPKGVVFGGR